MLKPTDKHEERGINKMATPVPALQPMPQINQAPQQVQVQPAAQIPVQPQQVAQPPLPQAQASEPAAVAEEPKKRGRKKKDPNAQQGTSLIPLPPKDHEVVKVKLPLGIAWGVQQFGGEKYLEHLIMTDLANRGLLVVQGYTPAQ